MSPLRERYPSCPPEFRAQRGTVNPYVFMDVLSDELSDNDILVTDCGANLIQTFQGMRIKRGQRVFSAFNNSPMRTLSVSDHTALGDAIREAIRIDGPVLCNLEFAQEQRIVPMLKAGRPIEDPLPLLDRDEFRENMIVAPMPGSRES